MTFAIDGGIEWDINETDNTLIIRPTDTPQSGYTKGRMKDYGGGIGTPPWNADGRKIDIQEGVTNIGNMAFLESEAVGTLTIPSSVVSIGDYAFSVCTNLTGSLTIPNGVTTIGLEAFAYSSGFTDITFLGNQPTLGSEAFYLNDSSPEKTYDVYTNGWANTTTFPSYDYTKWNYISSGNTIRFKMGGTWKEGASYIKVNGQWKQGIPYIKVGGSWKTN